MKSESEVSITQSAEETQKIGERFAKTLTGAHFIALFGELGAGKTTFVQGFAKGLGVQQKIISPTFLIIRRYPLLERTSENMAFFYHIDLYRLQTMEEVNGLGVLDIINEKNAIVMVEWPERMGSLLPKHRTDIAFAYINENQRKVTRTFSSDL